VLPIYGVEAWVGSCLDSIAKQSFSDYEIVVVDDGSLDGSLDIVERRARRDSRIKVVRKRNAGLGAARNTGVAHADGDLLTFVDSDDEVVRGAWGRMVNALDSTGSDFVVGRMDRDDGQRRSTMPLMRENHLADRYATMLDESPLALADVFACNKVFRRAFWDSNHLSFPEGVRYEDQPTLTDAFLASRRFDLLSAPVYVWKTRADGTSITQRRHEIADLEDRALTKRMSADAVSRSASASVAHVFYARVLPVDMWEYFRASTQAGEEYWDLLVDLVNDLWGESTVRFHETGVPAHQRLMGWLTAQGRRPDLNRWIGQLDESGGPQFADGYLIHPWPAEVSLPRAI